MTNYELLLASLDLEKIANAILAPEDGEKPLGEWDFEDCKALVLDAGEKWLLRDLDEFSLDAVEKKEVMPVLNYVNGMKCFLDICGKLKGTIAPFKQYKDKNFILDWKTTNNTTLSTDWKDRLVDSWQWMLYSEVYQASIFIYRGLSRTKKGVTKELIIEVPDTNREEVIQYLSAVGGQLNSLRESKFEIFPRNKPFACNAYGRECEYYDSCMSYKKIPRGMLPEDKALSYSFMNNFMLCNERARRDALADGGDSEETNFGRAFHRGVAEMYSQSFKIYGT